VKLLYLYIYMVFYITNKREWVCFEQKSISLTNIEHLSFDMEYILSEQLYLVMWYPGYGLLYWSTVSLLTHL